MGIINPIDLDKYPLDKRKEFSIEEIPSLINQWLHESLDESYYVFLDKLLDRYVKLLKEKQIIVSQCFKERIEYQDVIGDIDELIDYIKKALNYYLDGSMSTSYYSFNKWWNGKVNHPGASLLVNKVYPIEKNDVFYRIRTDSDESKPFKAEDMFHIPFHYRNRVNTNRFSLPGFPALYMSRSIYTCWEEMRRPPFDKFCVSKIIAKEKVKLLDLRLWRTLSDKDSALEYLLMLPIIMACSIKTKDDTGAFKLEYVIPQMMLHSVIKENDYRGKHRYEGIVYNSTRFHQGLYSNDYSFSEDFIIPVRKSKEFGFCNKLCKQFQITDSIHSSYKEDMNLFPRTEGKIEVDYFQQLEKKLDNNLLKEIDANYKPIKNKSYEE